MTMIELRKLSLEFRRVSSYFLNSTMDNADVNLARFLKMINETPLIKGYIERKIEGVDCDFYECYGLGLSYWARFSPPENEAEHLKIQFDYLTFINNSKDITVLSQAKKYPWHERQYDAMIKNFVDMAFKPLIDFVIDQISLDLMEAEEKEKSALGTTFIQNIETLNGSANQQDSGTINANSFSIANDAVSTIELIGKILNSLPASENEDDAVENVRDDLEMAREQLQSDTPKKSRLRKAIIGIKMFAKELPMGVATSLATNAIISTDWTALIQQMELFLRRLG